MPKLYVSKPGEDTFRFLMEVEKASEAHELALRIEELTGAEVFVRPPDSSPPQVGEYSPPLPDCTCGMENCAICKAWASL